MITPSHLRSTGYWIDRFRDTIVANPPVQLHIRELDDAGNPQMHPEFIHWLEGTSGRREGTEDRARLNAALKLLRNRSIREYEVLYRVLYLGQPIPEVAEWLNERSIRGGHPERYSVPDTMVIVYAAVDKVRDWY